jgi:hypothetical protein
MSWKRAIAVATGSLLVLAATSGFVLAEGFGEHGGGGRDMWLLARAAGLDHSRIATAFASDTNLATDRTNLKSADEALMSCLVAGAAQGCNSQISSYSSALQSLAQERMTVWQTLFKAAPNPSQAASVYTQLQQLHSTRKQIFQSVFGQGDSGSSSSSSATPND